MDLLIRALLLEGPHHVRPVDARLGLGRPLVLILRRAHQVEPAEQRGRLELVELRLHLEQRPGEG